MKLVIPARTVNVSPGLKRSVPIVAGAVLIILAGVSGLIYASLYSPLIILGGIAIIVVFLVWLMRPIWALYTALLLVFLPTGLIPPSIHSLLNRSVTVMAAGVWFVNVLRMRKKIIWTTPALCMAFFLVWSCVTLLWGENKSTAISVLQVYILRFILFLLLIKNEINTKQHLDGLMKTLALSGWILMLSVVITLIAKGYTPGARLKVFDANENGVGLLALIGMIGVVWQASQSSEKFRSLKILATVIYVLFTVSLIAMSGSRGSALSLLIVFLIFGSWKPLRAWAILGVLIVIFSLIFNASLFTTLVERFSDEGGDTLLGGREILWQAAWRMIQDHPIGGVGLGNTPYVVLRYLETDPRIFGAEKVVVHNPILTVWSETGLLGILAYLGVLISAMYLFGKQYLNSVRQQNFSLNIYYGIVSACFIGYMVSWIKGGGMESDFSYFFFLALLTLPSVMDLTTFKETAALHKRLDLGVGV